MPALNRPGDSRTRKGGREDRLYDSAWMAVRRHQELSLGTGEWEENPSGWYLKDIGHQMALKTPE